MYSFEDYKTYEKAKEDMCAAEEKLCKRACHVYIKIYEKFLKEFAPEDGGWELERLYEACRMEVGQVLALNFVRNIGGVKVEVATDDRVHIRSYAIWSGESTYLGYCFDAKFLWDEPELDSWIERSVKDAEELRKKIQEKADAEAEAKDRADYERLKAKFGNG